VTKEVAVAVDGIHNIHLQTHNWGKAVAFWRELGFALEEEAGGSGMLQAPGGGPYLYLEEVPEGRSLVQDVYLNVVDADVFSPGPPVEVVSGFQPTHWGTSVMVVRDPDGRLFHLQDPTGKAGQG
jgi:hypothetical protein